MAEEVAKQQQVFEDTLAAATKMPGVRIDRTSFLRSSLKKHCDEATIEKAVEQTPAEADIPLSTVKAIANESINYETAKVTALSAAAGIPGGMAMLGTVPADLAQFYAHVLRVAQKLAYLYSWPDLFDENGEMDDGTKSILTLFLGVMSGVQAANGGVAKIADMLAANLVKKLPQKALTKGVVYPVVKKVAGYLGVQMTKQVFAKGVGKVVPVVGGVVSGGITLATFRPMCAKLRDYLEGLPLAQPASQRKADVQDEDTANGEVADDILEVEAEVIEPVTEPRPEAETAEPAIDAQEEAPATEEVPESEL